MSVNFSKAEHEVLWHWRDIDAFQTQLRLTQDRPRFTFYDGPPFATGLPHYGHLLGSTIKDIIPRYWSMKGYHVSRRFGWDTHGVPIEYEIDKKLNLSAPEAVKQMGIKKYNALCRSIVMTYSAEWRHTIERLRRWIDFDNDYKSCWWVFKKLFHDGHVYRAYRVMPYSTKLCTPLSHMESKENEKEIQDPAILASFPVVGVEGKEDTSLVAYTTTPWTLPSNLLIAVHPNFEYLEVLDENTHRRYILLESGLSMLYKAHKEPQYKVLSKISGKSMVGWKYEPLFNYFTDSFSDCFQVIAASYVEAGEGTGIVHLAPAFGQEDYDAAIAAGFISPARLPPCPVDDAGCFTTEVPEYAGQHVKEAADKAILRDLRPAGRLLVESQVTHVDKLCPRSNTPLIRRAVSSWFIRVTDCVPDMLKNLEKTNWVPTFVKEKRFANWVANAHDWNVSRNRYWGTPIPLWVSDDYEEVVCVGSVEELRHLSGFDGPLDDLHRDKIDGITIPSKKGKGVLRRVDEVFDCWFESGSMPYASVHYPFENSDAFHQGLFPADFIAEGLDQTRGWFYTLTVLGNKLFKTSPFKNVIVNGIVLDKIGKKISKRVGNYPDPNLILEKYGADALRLFLVNSAVLRGEPMRFVEEGIKDIAARVLLPLWNSYRFFHEQTLLFKQTTGQNFTVQSSFGSNLMDRWILADYQSLLGFMEEEMKGYRLYTVVPRLLQSIDNLTNWYIRFNRKRLKGAANLGPADTTAALNTLLQVLYTMVRALAPFAPFLTEHIYQLLRPFLAEATASLPDARSVHFLPFPTTQEELCDLAIERQVAAMQKVITLARTARERSGMSLKTPLACLVVISETVVLKDVSPLEPYIREELNIREVILTETGDAFGLALQAKVDWPRLGKKLNKAVQVVRKALPGLSQAALRGYQRTGKMELEGILLEEGDLTLEPVVGDRLEHGPRWELAFVEGMTVLVDVAPNPELIEEGLVRELVNRFQRLRKKAGLVPTDEVGMRMRVVSDPDGVGLGALVVARQEVFVAALRERVVEVGEEGVVEGSVVVEDQQSIGNALVLLQLVKA